MKRINYASKLLFGGLFFCLMITGSAYAQADSDANTAQSPSMDDLQIRPMRLPSLAEVGGSMFLTPDFKLASVQTNDNKTVTKVPVKFNIFNNAVMVQKDGQEMKLESFNQVSYDVTENNGTIKHFVFKSGYPEIDKNTDKTIYQVLSIGPKVHLLKLLTQKVEDVNTLGDYSRREIVTSVQLYMYVPGGEIKPIKSGKKEIMVALPDLSAKIEEIANTNGLKLKSESDITLLVEELNKP